MIRKQTTITLKLRYPEMRENIVSKLVRVVLNTAEIYGSIIPGLRILQNTDTIWLSDL